MQKRVLVVDDERSITDGLLALLELENIDAVGAYDLDSAKALLEQEDYAVVLADVRLRTEEEGFELLARVKELNPQARIASMTGHASDEVREKVQNFGSTVLMEKPFAMQQIIEVVQRLLDDVGAAAEVTAENAGELYVALQRSMYAIPVKRFGFRAEEADDIVQEGFALYLQKMDQVMSPKSWLTGTIINLCKQRIHKNVRSREREEGIDVTTLEIPTKDHSDVIAVREALAQVDDRTRMLCTLIGIEGRSYDEVSEMLDIPVGSIGPTYIRAKAKLRRLLEVN